MDGLVREEGRECGVKCAQAEAKAETCADRGLAGGEQTTDHAARG